MYKVNAWKKRYLYIIFSLLLLPGLSSLLPSPPSFLCTTFSLAPFKFSPKIFSFLPLVFHYFFSCLGHQFILSLSHPHSCSSLHIYLLTPSLSQFWCSGTTQSLTKNQCIAQQITSFVCDQMIGSTWGPGAVSTMHPHSVCVCATCVCVCVCMSCT